MSLGNQHTASHMLKRDFREVSHDAWLTVQFAAATPCSVRGSRSANGSDLVVAQGNKAVMIEDTVLVCFRFGFPRQ